jgi:hypothetical protein
MYLLILLITAFGSIFYSFDDMLDPYDILPPKSWVPDILQISSNHASATSVTITVTCNIPADIPAGAVATLTIPGFPSSPFFYYLSTLQTSSSDNVFVFTGITNPSLARVYGPISLVVTQVLGGQILASSKAFFSLALLPAVTPGSLTVDYSSNSVSNTVSTDTSLTFSFPLSVALRQLDYIVLTLDSSWTIKSTLSAPTWNMAQPTTVAAWSTTGYQYVAGTASTLGTYTIYALQQDFATTTTISFTLSGFTNPAFVITAFSWDLKVMRFGTGTIRQWFTGTGPSTLKAGTIISASWGLSNSYLTATDSSSTSQVANGATLFNTFTFTTVNDIPASGAVQVTFGGVTSFMNNYPTDARQLVSTGSAYMDFSPKSAFADCLWNNWNAVITCILGSSALAGGSSVSGHCICGH